ncbi:CMRF35-like molecule 1 isoform X1 [Carassius auratus]|uniref:CMRF35-like molecule 1 isoform X1 n=1 Tax=Carassius auratus TaxID=7957 RepID=A0A6P6PSV2_CARAU|nr:CMRF35-like molecule 1 isoform X1 [Carassius auratus]
MKVHLKILSVFIVLPSVLMTSGNVYVRTVGEGVDIRCTYPVDHKNTLKYLCRHPCKSSKHVLIKAAKPDLVVSDGRYSLFDNVGVQTFTVTIKNLSMTDSGVYYCGLDRWFTDTLNKVNLSVYQAVPVSRSTHTPENTHITSTWTTTLTSADNSSSYEQFSSASPVVQSKGSTLLGNSVSITVACAGLLVMLVFGVLVALVSLCRKRSDLKSRCLRPPVPENPVQNSPNLNLVSQTVDNGSHLYDEIVTEYSMVGLARYGDSTVEHCDPAPQNDEDTLYSFIMKY